MTLALFTEDTNLHFRVLIFLIDVDRQIVQLLDEFLEVFRFDLRQVDGNSFCMHSIVGTVKRLRWNQAGEAYSGAQQLHGHADIHFRRAFMTAIVL